MRDQGNTDKLRSAARKLPLAIVISALSAGVRAESRTATTTIGLKVERHTGLYLPAASSGLTSASFKEGHMPARPTSFGNSRAQLMVSDGRSAGFEPTANSAAPQRLVVTAFDP